MDLPEINEQLDILSKGLNSANKFSESKEYQIIPTDLVGLNRAGKVGGMPASTIVTVYGPSGEGKTVFCLGMLSNYQKQNHFTAIIDSEFSLDKQFVINTGVDPERLIWIRPESYEQTVKETEKLFKNFKKGREKGNFHPNTCLCLVVDSINKLIPESEISKLGKADRAYPIRATMNSSWMDSLNIQVANDNIGVYLVAHEKKTLDAGPWDEQTHMKGGDALKYESRMQIRINVKKRLKEEIGGKKIQIGKIHKGLVKKNKVGAEGGDFYFVVTNEFSDNGIGFDKILEVMEECKLRGSDSVCIRKPGAVWVWDKLPDGQVKSDKNFEHLIRSDPEMLNNLIKDLNETSTPLPLYENLNSQEEEL